MNPERFVEVQRDMRRNQTELQDYLSDLQSWKKTMAEKERVVVKGEAKPEPELPPVRGSLEKKRRKRKPAPTSGKIRSGDYRKWDKFDVDAALDAVDNGAPEDEDGSTDDEAETERRRQLAVAEKDRGNSQFKAGNYELAIESYTRALDCDATCALYAANRAMAQLKLTRYGAAEADCTIALRLDPSYDKAYYRRAVARRELGKLEGARADFKHVLELDANNVPAREGLKQVTMALQPLATPRALQVAADAIVRPIYKTRETASKLPLRRVPIVEVSGGDNFNPTPTRPVTEVPKVVELSERTTNSDVNSARSETVKEEKKLTSQWKRERGREAAVVAREQRLWHQVNSMADDSSLTATLNGEEKRPPMQHPWERQPRASLERASEFFTTACGFPQYEVDLVAPDVSPDVSPSDFLRLFRRWSGDTTRLYGLLAVVTPQRLPGLLGNNCEPSMFSELIRLVYQYEMDGRCPLEVLAVLTKFQRFSTLSLFMSRDEKRLVEIMLGRVDNRTAAAPIAKAFGLEYVV